MRSFTSRRTRLHGVVAGLDGRVTDALREGAVAGEHDGCDPLVVVREVTQIELRHDVVPSLACPGICSPRPEVLPTSGVEASPFIDKTELQVRVSIAFMPSWRHIGDALICRESADGNVGSRHGDHARRAGADSVLIARHPPLVAAAGTTIPVGRGSGRGF